MKLLQVRKGQFVYFNNELHKVYGVKPVYKKSVHLIKLKDLSQHLSTAAEIDRYKPQHLDSFTFNHKTYTLHKEKRAVEGSLILITNPNPDYLDNYSLNAIEVVETVESGGVITTKSNGIKHNEYILMIPGRDSDSHPIDYQDMSIHDEPGNDGIEQPDLEDLPNIGDVYKRCDTDLHVEAMVVALRGNMITLGNNIEISLDELNNSDKWEFMYSLLDNLS